MCGKSEWGTWVAAALFLTAPGLISAVKQCFSCQSKGFIGDISGNVRVPALYIDKGTNCSQPASITLLDQYKFDCASFYPTSSNKQNGDFYCEVTAYYAEDVSYGTVIERSCFEKDKLISGHKPNLENNSYSCINSFEGGVTIGKNRTHCVCKNEACNTANLLPYSRDNKYDFGTNPPTANSNTGGVPGDGAQNDKPSSGSADGGNSPISSRGLRITFVKGFIATHLAWRMFLYCLSVYGLASWE